MSRTSSRIFKSVFPPPSDIDLPTPDVTPLLPSSNTFEELTSSQPKSRKSLEQPKGGAAEQIKWDRAWHNATAFLSLPPGPISAADEEKVKQDWCRVADTETKRALEYLLDENSKGRRLRAAKDGGSGSEDLLRWYFETQIVGHFMDYMRPHLQSIFDDDNAHVVEEIFDVGRHLYLAQTVYLWPVKQNMLGYLGADAQHLVRRLETDIQGIILRVLPKDKKEVGLKRFFLHQASVVLGVDMKEHAPAHAAREPLGAAIIERERQKTKDWVIALKGVGLGGHQTEAIFAEAMAEILDGFVKTTFSRKWKLPCANAEILRSWVASGYVNFIALILGELHSQRSLEVSYDARQDIERWNEMGLLRLGVLRTEELFSIVTEWGPDVYGAIEDLKAYVKDARSRAALTTTFSDSLHHRLLQPAASTSHILKAYISIIRVFTLLDPRGVLLDRVARPIRRYLREREDAVSIVVGGLLADTDQDGSTEDTLTELAIEMSKQKDMTKNDDKEVELDFDDMDWMPDPVDAGPDFKKSKHFDVIGSCLSLFESKDVFIKEFQNILGERLLQKKHDFQREKRVLDLLILRFGESSLQACEVMLRDIQDSRTSDSKIRKDQTLLREPNLHSRILSHLYWPALHEETFLIPPEIRRLQERYAAGFESMKASRKLTWLHALGQVTVDLQMEDRAVTEEVQTWQATVIYAFQPTSGHDSLEPVVRNIPELANTLEMPESLIVNAITFWIGKLVLKPVPSPPYPPRSFAVLETLADEAAAQEGTTSAAVAAAAETITSAPAPAVLDEHEMAREKMGVYAQFVVGMLTNGGAMPLQQIVMMLKLTVPGGFPFGNEELKMFLEGEVRDERLDFSGGAYKIRR